MKTLIFLSLLLTGTMAQAALYGKIAKCTRTDNVLQGDLPTVIYILTTAMDGDFSKDNDGLIVVESNDELVGELGTPVLATTVDIVSNLTSYTIPNDGIYGDSLTFKDGEVVENQGMHATFACEMTY